MEFQHELIIPNEGLPFKVFFLKEEMAIMCVRSTGIRL